MAPRTKSKARDAYLRRVYGISLQQYDELLNKQGGGCAVCGKTPKEEGRNLAVDHSHRSPFSIRGILCFRCNHTVIGRHHDADLFSSASRYLRGPFTAWCVPVKKKRRKKRKRK